MGIRNISILTKLRNWKCLLQGGWPVAYYTWGYTEHVSQGWNVRNLCRKTLECRDALVIPRSYHQASARNKFCLQRTSMHTNSSGNEENKTLRRPFMHTSLQMFSILFPFLLAGLEIQKRINSLPQDKDGIETESGAKAKQFSRRIPLRLLFNNPTLWKLVWKGHSKPPQRTRYWLQAAKGKKRWDSELSWDQRPTWVY